MIVHRFQTFHSVPCNLIPADIKMVFRKTCGIWYDNTEQKNTEYCAFHLKFQPQKKVFDFQMSCQSISVKKENDFTTTF